MQLFRQAAVLVAASLFAAWLWVQITPATKTAANVVLVAAMMCASFLINRTVSRKGWNVFVVAVTFVIALALLLWLAARLTAPTR